MSKIEKNIPQNYPEKNLNNLEKWDIYNSWNIQKMVVFCETSFNKPKNKKEICALLENTFQKELAKKWIDFKQVLKA